MNYIIFGGSGFIGSHLIQAIQSEFPDAKIYNFDIQEKKYENIVYNYCDVRKKIEASIETTDNDVIFNFAAIHRTPGYPDNDYFETNIKGAENVTRFAKEKNIKRIVFTSSIAPYAASEDKKGEETLPTPNTPYGISKLVAEKIHMIWQSEENQSRYLLILRPGVVFGKGENGNFTRLFYGIKNNRFLYPGRKDTIKACIYVKDLVRFMLFRLKNDEKSVELFNCSYYPPYTIEFICNEIMKVTGVHHHIFKLPAWFILSASYFISLLGGKKLLGICPARVRKLMISTNISGKKMAKSGYPFLYSFEEALADWYKDNDNQVLR